jgi:N-acetylglucosaminyldiphosphoundecaprenol N-acetyl-beta-D-mannosaminyltransferase
VRAFRSSLWPGVADLGKDDVVRAVVDEVISPQGRPFTLFALHIGGLLVRRRPDFRAAMRRADLTYADGISVVLLARLAGAKRIGRAATTDIGWTILEQSTRGLGRPPRLAAIGGRPGLAESALETFERRGVADGVFATHGYHENWVDVLAAAGAAKPDIVLVGLGAPREMKWVDQHLDALPPAVILTCGGWFGHVVGDEARAPLWFRQTGLEWVYRFAQAPGRLGPRYLKGLAIFPALCVAALGQRVRASRRRVLTRP